MNRHDRNYEIIFKDVKAKVKQVSEDFWSDFHTFLSSSLFNRCFSVNRSPSSLSPCFLWLESCTPTARCVKLCPHWRWPLASSPWLGGSLTCSCPPTWRRCCRWETRWLSISSRSAYLRHPITGNCSAFSLPPNNPSGYIVGLETHKIPLTATFYSLFNNETIKSDLNVHSFNWFCVGHEITGFLFCPQAFSMCCLKHCVALWQLLASLKSENMLRIKKVSHRSVLPVNWFYSSGGIVEL